MGKKYKYMTNGKVVNLRTTINTVQPAGHSSLHERQYVTGEKGGGRVGLRGGGREGGAIKVHAQCCTGSKTPTVHCTEARWRKPIKSC